MGGQDGTDGVVGNWNENRGGVSRTERGKTSGSPATSFREFLTGAGGLENQTKWARFQRLVRQIPNTTDHLDSILGIYQHNA